MNIKKGADGVYRWVYDLNLFKNPTVMYRAWRLFGISFGVLWILVAVFKRAQENFWFSGFLALTRDLVIILAVLLAASAVIYYLYALLLGGKLCILFEMDEHGVRHSQVPKYMKKNDLVKKISAFVDEPPEEPLPPSTGMIATVKTSMYSDFGKIKKIAVIPERECIKIIEALGKNQVRAAGEEFDFVSGYILNHLNKSAKAVYKHKSRS